jgi:hypothetical protein
MRVFGDHDDGQRAHRPRRVISADARAQQHHLLVGKRGIAAGSIEQLAIRHAPGHDHGIKIFLEVEQRDVALADGSQHAPVVIDRPSDGHARLASSQWPAQ